VILINCTQGSEEWLKARCAAITASRAADAISVLSRKSGDKNPGDPTAASDKYALHSSGSAASRMESRSRRGRLSAGTSSRKWLAWNTKPAPATWRPSQA
jgi:hypothetical protein